MIPWLQNQDSHSCIFSGIFPLSSCWGPDLLLDPKPMKTTNKQIEKLFPWVSLGKAEKVATRSKCMKRPPLFFIFYFFFSNISLVFRWISLLIWFDTMQWSVCALHSLFQRAYEFIPNQSNAISTPKSPVAMKSDACAANGMNQELLWGSRQSWIQPRDSQGKTWAKWDTASRQRWSRQEKITPLSPFFKHAGVNLSPPRWLSRSSPPRSPKPRGNSHAKKAMRGADLFGMSDKFPCAEQPCAISQQSKFWAYYNTLG